MVDCHPSESIVNLGFASVYNVHLIQTINIQNSREIFSHMLLGHNVANWYYGHEIKTNFHIHVWSHIQNGSW